MAILTFALGALLVIAGGVSLYMSLDLVPTEMGLCYALSGVIFLSASGGVCAIAALIARLDRIFKPANASAPSEAAPATTEPEVVARYDAGGAKYVLFSNGVIEAETADGGLRFATMDAFKAYIAGKRA